MNATEGSFEQRLQRALAADPSATQRSAIDQRVRAAIAAVPVSARTRVGLGVGRLRLGRTGLVVGLLGAVLVLGAAGGGLQSLYGWMVGGFGGYQVQWDGATVLGLSTTSHGYRVTVERAYADPNQVMVAISVQDVAKQPSSQLAVFGGRLVDDEGHEYDGISGASSPNGTDAAADLLWYRTPAGVAAGPRTFKLTIDSIQVRDLSTPPPSEDPTWNPWHGLDGPWSFTFTVPMGASAPVRPNASATVNGLTLHLQSVSASDASIVAVVAGEGGSATDFALIGEFTHDGASYPISQSTSKTGAGPVTLEALSSTADRSGHWQLRVDQVLSLDGASEARLAGPWILSFDLP